MGRGVGGQAGGMAGRQGRSGREAEPWSIKARSRSIHKSLPTYVVFLRWFVPSFLSFPGFQASCLPTSSPEADGVLIQARFVRCFSRSRRCFSRRCPILLFWPCPSTPPHPLSQPQRVPCPFTHAALMGYDNPVTNVTIAMWYTPAESRGVGVSPIHHSSQYAANNSILRCS